MRELVPAEQPAEAPVCVFSHIFRGLTEQRRSGAHGGGKHVRQPFRRHVAQRPAHGAHAVRLKQNPVVRRQARDGLHAGIVRHVRADGEIAALREKAVKRVRPARVPVYDHRVGKALHGFGNLHFTALGVQHDALPVRGGPVELRGKYPALRVHGRIAPDAVQPDLAHERGARHVGQQVVQTDSIGVPRVHAHGQREDGVLFRKRLPLRGLLYAAAGEHRADAQPLAQHQLLRVARVGVRVVDDHAPSPLMQR